MLCNIVLEAQAIKLINILGLDICNEIAALAEDDFSAFPWRLPFDEDAQSNDIVKHLRAHAGSFLDSLGFKLADTHSNKSCLDFESSTIGTITGGTDAIIVAKSLNVASSSPGVCFI